MVTKPPRPRVFTEVVPVKFSKELLKIMDYLVKYSTYFDAKGKPRRLYSGRSTIIRDSFINFAKSKLDSLGKLCLKKA